MDVSHILDPLNDAQRQAVCTEQQRCLVLAGAGSGKTRVLIHRIAWLTEVLGISPYAVMAVTFTNKAAHAMRDRAELLMGHESRGLWVGTFHSIANRLLRMHPEEAGLNPGFQILDADDQLRIIRRLLKSHQISEKDLPAKTLQWFINANKDEGLRAAQVPDTGYAMHQTQLELYAAYDEICQQNGAVDFAELLLRCLELLRDNEPLRQLYQNRFSHLLVDEFQDTNAVQYQWLQYLAGNENHQFAVGDDDQSIYAWRGARVDNLFDFAKQDQTVETVRLEQNYRSTQTILDAANAVIQNNQSRLGKKLWTEHNPGQPIERYNAMNEVDEARYVVRRIHQWLEQGGNAAEIAVLYRANAQSRALEDALLREDIPYRIYGGMRFYERAEIKDALGYLRLLINPDDDVAFDRVVNTPARGVGESTMARLRQHAQSLRISLWQACEEMLEQNQLRGRPASGLSDFQTLIREMTASCAGAELQDIFRTVLEQSHILDHYQKEAEDRFLTRRENLEELVSAATRFVFVKEDEEAGLSPLQAFLNEVALDSDTDQGQDFRPHVQLMTLHSAKGLEFPLVFLTGLEEGLFPSARSMDEPNRLEEERRLCYVGITRAMQHLVISHTDVRRVYGSEVRNRPSRFLLEIPKHLQNEPQKKSSTAVIDHDFPFQAGDTVSHARFGEGVVLSLEGDGPHTRIQVQFAQEGVKWLVQAYAKLEKC